MEKVNKNLRSICLDTRHQKLSGRVKYFYDWISTLQHTYRRTILSKADREVLVKDPLTGHPRAMLMFASNNYLGFASHPYITTFVKKAIDQFGNGIGGPPLLNGHIKLIAELEERLALLKSQESALLFSSGFMANMALVTALTEQQDCILYDEASHASFYDGLKISNASAKQFRHNDTEELCQLLSYPFEGSRFVCVEGVYSMDGDISPLDKVSALCRSADALLIVDDAHGTGVLGQGGRGTAALLNCEKEIDITMGTFSKAFAACGGFITASKPVIEYLRYYARPYMFSASIPPAVAATVLAGLDLLEKEPWLRDQLMDNVKYAVQKLSLFGLYAPPQAAIITLSIPEGMDIRKSAWLFHEKGIFINPIEYPAVPVNKQRFRITVMATHTREDIDKLAAVVEEIWHNPEVYT